MTTELGLDEPQGAGPDRTAEDPDTPPAGGAALRDRLRTMLPRIAANVEQGEEARRIPDENIALVREVGLTRAFVPRRYGGLESRLEDYGPCLVDLSEACGATGWVTGLLAQHAHALALFPRELQDELWGANPDALVASSVAPVGAAEVVSGGIRLSGRFAFSSGCDHADWFVLGFRHPAFDGVQARHYAVVPRADVAIVDDWHTAGMRATGSKSLMVEGAFVPEHRYEGVIGLNTGRSQGFGSNEGAIYHAAFGPHFAIGFAAVAIGMVRRMAEVYTAKTRSRIKVYTGANATTRAPAAMRLGRGVHGNEAALAFLEKDWRAIDARCDSRTLPSPRELSAWRTNQAFCIQLSIEAADALFGGSGGSAWYSANEMQRLWRNVRMCGAHAGTDYDTASEIYGRNLLGLEPDPTL